MYNSILKSEAREGDGEGYSIIVGLNVALKGPVESDYYNELHRE